MTVQWLGQHQGQSATVPLLALGPFHATLPSGPSGAHAGTVTSRLPRVHPARSVTHAKLQRLPGIQLAGGCACAPLHCQSSSPVTMQSSQMEGTTGWKCTSDPAAARTGTQSTNQIQACATAAQHKPSEKNTFWRNRCLYRAKLHVM